MKNSLNIGIILVFILQASVLNAMELDVLMKQKATYLAAKQAKHDLRIQGNNQQLINGIFNEDLDAIECALNNGADMYVRIRQGDTALALAQDSYQNYINKYGKEKSYNDKEFDPIQYISMMRIFKRFMKKYHAVCERVLNPIFRARLNKPTHIISCYVHLQYDYDRPPLSSFDLVAFLDLGHNKNCINYSGQTLLHKAVERCDSDWVNLLLKHNIDCSIADKHGHTAADVARATYWTLGDRDKKDRMKTIWTTVVQKTQLQEDRKKRFDDLPDKWKSGAILAYLNAGFAIS